MKIISYSLFGDNPYYLDGAVLNVEMAKNVFPGWICRFYVDHNVPTYYINKLKELGAEIIIMQRKTKSQFEAISWRFAAATDSDVMIVRDTDSALLERDKIAVDEWLASDKDFHIIRDYTFSSSRIMGGIWGCRNGILKDVNIYLEKWLNKSPVHWFGPDDMLFLNMVIWPLVKDNAYIHDQYGLQFTDETTYKIDYTYDSNNYIGAKI
jgi:hypothetical protein